MTQGKKSFVIQIKESSFKKVILHKVKLHEKILTTL